MQNRHIKKQQNDILIDIYIAGSLVLIILIPSKSVCEIRRSTAPPGGLEVTLLKLKET